MDMSVMLKRIKRLEVFKVEENLRVVIFRWGRGDQQELGNVSCGDKTIERNAMESEDDFMSRAYIELGKLANPSQMVITGWANYTWQERNVL